MLMPRAVTLVPRPDDLADVDESGDTLDANARLKAAAVCSAAGMPAIADDTGLEVDALDGAPGVHTARFAGPDADADANIKALLTALAEVDAHQRTARFRTVAMVLYPDGRALTGEGVVEGIITTERRGRQGFGYDPVFRPLEGDGRVFAEMSASEKNAMSHRARAIGALVQQLEL